MLLVLFVLFGVMRCCCVVALLLVRWAGVLVCGCCVVSVWRWFGCFCCDVVVLCWRVVVLLVCWVVVLPCCCVVVLLACCVFGLLVCCDAVL